MLSKTAVKVIAIELAAIMSVSVLIGIIGTVMQF